jgi:hypothetical protein
VTGSTEVRVPAALAKRVTWPESSHCGHEIGAMFIRTASCGRLRLSGVAALFSAAALM